MSFKYDFYLLCPVRKATKEQKEFLESYLTEQERRGLKGFYPPRNNHAEDTDPIGLEICSRNKIGIKTSQMIHAYWIQGSEGSMFDIGMIFMDQKPIYLIDWICPSIGNELDQLVKEHAKASISEITPSYERFLKRRAEILLSDYIEYEWQGLNPHFLFDFGMTFMAEKLIRLTNRDDVPRTPHKSFQNVLLELDALNPRLE